METIREEVVNPLGTLQHPIKIRVVPQNSRRGQNTSTSQFVAWKA